MKKIIRYISRMMLASALLMSVAACSPVDFQSVNEAGIPIATDYADAINVRVDQETNYAYFEFAGAKGVYPIWIVDGKSYSSSFNSKKYYRKAGDYSVEVKIGNANGQSDGAITKTFHIDKTRMSGFGGFVYDGEFNLWKGATVATPLFYYAVTSSWQPIADPSYSFDGDAYTVNWTQATVAQWQAQMKLNTDIVLEAGKSYDGSVILTSNKDHSNITWKICEDTGDDTAGDSNILYNNDGKIAVKAGEPLCVWFSDMLCENGIPKVKVVFDFGGNEENTEIVVENLVIKDHANDDGTVLPKVDDTPEPTWVAVDSEDNLWKAATITTSFFYANSDWQPKPVAPTMTTEGTSYSVSFPEGTEAQWQNQVAFNTDLTSDTETAYDFHIILKSSQDVGQVTVKLVQTDEVGTDGQPIKHDGNYFFDKKVDLSAGAEQAVWAASVKAKEAMHAISLVLDFGGNPANTDVVIKDIIFQKHKD